MREINLYNQYHLGDNIFNINYLNKYDKHDYIFNYYVNPHYIEELKFHVTNRKINLRDIHEYNTNMNGYDMWIGADQYFHERIKIYEFKYDIFYYNYFQYFAKKVDIDNVIYTLDDTLFTITNYDHIHVEPIYDKYDYLIINSTPMSGQFDNDETDFEKLCEYLLSIGKKIITTKKVQNIECTLDYNYNLIQVGKISNLCENIIAINTSPIVTTFNNININTIKKRYILDRNLTYSYNDSIIVIKTMKDLYIHI